MAIKAQKEEKAKAEKSPEEIEQDNQIPMIPNYLDLILGEVNAIRVMLENQQK